MSLILRQVIGYSQGRRTVSATADPALKKQLEESQKQLNSILKKWKFGDSPIKTSQEFLNNFEPWINNQLNQQKELKIFLAKKGVNNLTEAETKLTNRELGEGEPNRELKEFLEFHGANNLTELEQTWQNTEADYLRQIEELKASRESHSDPFELEALQLEIKDLKEQLATYAKGEDWESQTASVIASLEQEVNELTTEKDAAIRTKNEAEQDLLATANRLKNKSQEADSKAQQIELLKREKSQSEISLNKRIEELRKDQKDLKQKYSKQSQLLDTEQLEGKRLEEEVEKLQAEIAQLKK